MMWLEPPRVCTLHAHSNISACSWYESSVSWCPWGISSHTWFRMSVRSLTVCLAALGAMLHYVLEVLNQLRVSWMWGQSITSVPLLPRTTYTKGPLHQWQWDNEDFIQQYLMAIMHNFIRLVGIYVPHEGLLLLFECPDISVYRYLMVV